MTREKAIEIVVWNALKWFPKCWRQATLRWDSISIMEGSHDYHDAPYMEMESGEERWTVSRKWLEENGHL